MVQSYTPKTSNEKKYNKRNSRKISRIPEEQPENKDYLDLWDVNPSFKDINNTISIIKCIFLLVLTIGFVVSLYIVTNNLRTSLIIGVLFNIVFIMVFHKEFFYLQTLFSHFYRKIVSIDPFERYSFWFNKDDPTTLFTYNKNDLITVAMRIYSIEVIPENIQPNIDAFVKSLSVKDIRVSYSYQVIQKPIINLTDINAFQQESVNPYTSAIGKIYFTVFFERKGLLTNNKMERIIYYIKQFSALLKSNIVANFHHFKAKLLSDDALLNALSLLYIRVGSEEESENKDTIEDSHSFIYFKLSVLIFILIYVGWFFSQVIFLDTLFVLLIDVILALFIIFVWWRSILFGITKRYLLKTSETDFVSPFRGVKFYTVRKFPYNLFMHIDNKLLVGMKMVNLKYIYNSPYCKFDRFIEALNNHKIYFTYTLKNEPLHYYYFEKHGLKSVHEKIKNTILFHPHFKIKNANEEEKWLSYRKGMWYSFLTLSVNSYKYVDSFDMNDFEQLEEILDPQINTLKGAFRSNFENYEIEDLKTNRLLSGYLFSVFKHNRFRLNGSHLSYVMLQGATLAPLSYIENILKKSIDSRIPAEFNTPLHLRNDLTIGYTINTEVLEQEVPVGFLYEQIKNLLVVNGTPQSRELTLMKVVSELIQHEKPSLIFDFNGRWTKLLSLFEGSRYVDDILHFRLGAAFTTNPLVSEIPYDTHNPEYIEYMLDAFALAFKKDQRTIDMFRSTISKNPEMDLPSMQLELQTQSDWQKTPLSYSLQNLFSDLTPQDKTLFQDLQGENKILSHDFICNEKTIIVDLSILKDLNKKLFFTFLILSKIIHFITYKKKFQPKIIVVPHVDLFFEARFLDMRLNYGKINSFLDPLVEHGFGLLFSANQIHYLHPNIHTYFSNIITFRATHNRDVAILKNLLSLQEIPGAGVYSQYRHQKYQIEYLKSLNLNYTLIKRDDIYQTFPAIIDWKELKKLSPCSYEHTLTFMGTQGYDLRSAEKRILDGAKQTIFEKDLGQYYFYIDEIINFMKSVRSVDRVGNLYEKKVKDELMECLYPKLSKKTNDKKYMKNARNEIYNKLLIHGYLEENHPKRASGSESLATSYKVGNPYDVALNDYFEISNDIMIEEVIEGVEEELDEDIFPSPTRKYIIRQENLFDALKREFGSFYYDISKIYDLIGKGEYSNAIKIEQITIKKFLVNAYRHYYNIDRAVMPSEMTPFFELLEKMESFPFTADELKYYINQYQQINLDVEDSKVVAERVYESLSNFFNKVNNYLVQE